MTCCIADGSKCTKIPQNPTGKSQKTTKKSANKLPGENSGKDYFWLVGKSLGQKERTIYGTLY